MYSRATQSGVSVAQFCFILSSELDSFWKPQLYKDFGGCFKGDANYLDWHFWEFWPDLPGVYFCFSLFYFMLYYMEPDINFLFLSNTCNSMSKDGTNLIRWTFCSYYSIQFLVSKTLMVSITFLFVTQDLRSNSPHCIMFCT